jgi:hypothetical protein
MSDETEKVYQKLEEVISICWELKKAEPFDKEVLPMLLSGSPDRTIFELFAWVMKLKKCVIS